jgi:methylthioribose-1-phosphate isomerase
LIFPDVMTELLAIKYHRGKLELLDQRLLPFESKYIGIETPQQAYDAIKDMAVRGAPAIGCTAALAVAAWLDIQGNGNGTQFSSASEATQAIQDAVDLLVER